MIDFYLTQFYQDVKDPSWPDISIYNDIMYLPQHIQDELEQTHGLSQRLNDIESIDNWRKTNREIAFGYCKNNVVFVPVLKCASTYFTHNFLNQFSDWKIVNLHDQDWTKIKAVGCMMHPLVRRLKGVTEMLFCAYSEDRLDELINLLKHDLSFRRVVANISVADMHSMPYTVMYGKYLDKIHWIPMEIGNNNMIVKVNEFLQENNINDQIPLDEAKHKSTDKKLQIFNLLIKVYFSHPANEFSSIFLFADDLRFYHKLIKSFEL